MYQCRHGVVKGRVQGVYYRDYTKKAADSLGICGWVRNLPNGDVEVMMTGDEFDLSEMEKRLWAGPPASQVESVSIKKCDEIESFSSFVILY